MLYQMQARGHDGSFGGVCVQVDFPDPVRWDDIKAWVEEVDCENVLLDGCEWFICTENSGKFFLQEK